MTWHRAFARFFFATDDLGFAQDLDSLGAHEVSHTWIHKITFVRDANGKFLVSRDQVLTMN